MTSINSLRDLFTVCRARMIAALMPVEDVEPMHKENGSHREQLIAKLLDLQQRSSAEAVARQKRVDALGVRIREAEAHMNELYGELETLWGERIAHSFRVDQELSRLQAELAATSQQGEYAHGTC